MKLVLRFFPILALVVALVPAPGGAVQLARDDGSFESNEGLAPGQGRAVDFDLPTAEPHDVTQVSLYFMNGGPQVLNLTVALWDQLLNQVYSAPVTVSYGAPGWYVIDLAPAGITLQGSLRVGVFQNAFTLAPFLGRDMTPPVSGHTWLFNRATAAWIPVLSHDAGIRVGVEPVVDELPPPPPPEPRAVAALACEGFGPPLHKPRALRRGGRTLPLKARLLDADGQQVGADGLFAAPVVQVLFTPEGGGDPVDVTDLATPAGRSNTGTAFRPSCRDSWRYNLKTRGFADPGTYEILLVSGDPAEYAVEPPCSAVITVGGSAPKARKHR